ncbi:MAG TPA: 3-isopropylmalate dehydratase small subunit [Acidobacteria bacterium]|jgi:3-isopropylmalate/(R)-2-methylmalate dehydratase small subunit|nr:3-isopropylmalate dehydratase small subunit [Acidobacteriota bacterium]
MSEVRAISRLDGTAIPVRGNNIDTDRIIPARFLKSITFDGLGGHVFEDDRQSMPNHPFSNPSYAGASILLVNENFGSGSSREHAPQALKRWGIAACIGESFSEIFLGNATTIGLPCATASAAGIKMLMDAVEQTPATRLALRVDALLVETAQLSHPVLIPAAIQESFLTGQWDAIGLLLDQFDQVRQVAAALPYVKGY